MAGISQTLSEEEQEQASDLMKKLQDAFPSDEHKQIVSGEQCDGLQSKYAKFVIDQSTSPTLAFWSSYIDMASGQQQKETGSCTWPQ